jgi:hypothetical protein
VNTVRFRPVHPHRLALGIERLEENNGAVDVELRPDDPGRDRTGCRRFHRAARAIPDALERMTGL